MEENGRREQLGNHEARLTNVETEVRLMRTRLHDLSNHLVPASVLVATVRRHEERLSSLELARSQFAGSGRALWGLLHVAGTLAALAAAVAALWRH